MRNITDLQPQEMARLEERFRPGGVDSGMGIEEFEKTMEEFTGMEGSLGDNATSVLLRTIAVSKGSPCALLPFLTVRPPKWSSRICMCRSISDTLR